MIDPRYPLRPGDRVICTASRMELAKLPPDPRAYPTPGVEYVVAAVRDNRWLELVGLDHSIVGGLHRDWFSLTVDPGPFPAQRDD